MAQFIDPDGSIIVAILDGVTMSIPAQPSNRHYQRLLADGIAIAPYAPPVPAPIRVITSRALMRRLAQPKRMAIVDAARTDPDVRYWLDMATAGPIELDHADTVAGIDALIAAGLLDQADKTALLADGTADEQP